MTKNRCAIAALVGAFLVWGVLGCEGDPGPQGPPGPTAAESCFGCHGDTPGSSSINLSYIAAEYETSIHATGETFVRRTAECSGCHSHEGFLQRVASGAFPTATQTHTSRIDCWTCHAPHTTGNFSLRTDEPVTFVAGGGTVNYGTGNLCISCHQARAASPAVPAAATDSIKVTNRWGPHHSTMGNLLAGKGGFFSATHPAVNSGHSSEPTIVAKGCVACHMDTPPSGGMAGGHSWKMAYDDHGNETQFVDACTSCHPSATDFDVRDGQTTIAALLGQVQARLLQTALIDSTNLCVPGYYSRSEAQAVWNYLFVLEDRSLGVHNTDYAEAMLQSALDFVPAPPAAVAKR